MSKQKSDKHYVNKLNDLIAKKAKNGVANTPEERERVALAQILSAWAENNPKKVLELFRDTLDLTDEAKPLLDDIEAMIAQVEEYQWQNEEETDHEP